MLNLFKKKVTVEEYGHQMWLFCCDCADKFCLDYRPKLQQAGYLKSSNADRHFMEEAMRLHLWIISRALGNEDRNILDVLHSHAHGLNLVNSRTLSDLYAIYDHAALKYNDLRGNGVEQPVIAMTALKCLVNDDAYSDCVVELLVQIDINYTSNAVRKIRSEFTVKCR
jgi:hypothetical protein